MSSFVRRAPETLMTSVSPYLLRPLRTYEQAVADIAAAKTPVNNIKTFSTGPSVKRSEMPLKLVAA